MIQSSPLFNQTYDAVIFGTGFLGLGAMRALTAKGRRVLWVDASSDLLWETSRALEDRGSAGVTHPAWLAWRQSLIDRQGATETSFEASLAEVLTAEQLKNDPLVSVLFHAIPVQAERDRDRIESVTVATKAGLRRLQARLWVDATESGGLSRLCLPTNEMNPRMPDQTFRSLVVQSTQWDQLAERLVLFPTIRPGWEWITSLRSTERRLRWPVSVPISWADDMEEMVRALRKWLTGAVGVISHASDLEFPIYSAQPARLLPVLPGNLCGLSPGWNGEALRSISDRFLQGWTTAEKLTLPAEVPSVGGLREPIITETETVDVLVIGTGTAGSIAALAAAREGGKTLAIDLAAYPGGIGTVGGITGYFKGMPGGMQVELDALSADYSEWLTGSASSGKNWHHLAKRLAILRLFREAGVEFWGATLLGGVEMAGDGLVQSAWVTDDRGVRRIVARAFIDASGDGDFCALAGAQFIEGRPGDGRTLSYSQVGLTLRASDSGLSLTSRNYDAGWVDATDPADLSRARLEGLAQYLRPKWTHDTRPLIVFPLLGLRQSRHIETDTMVRFDDLIRGTRFPDSIGEVYTCADTHSVDFEFESDEGAFYYWICQCFRQPQRCELPYRMMLPRGLANVWIACRAAGMEVLAAYGLRMQREMQRLGQAAGIAAARAARRGVGSRDIEVSGICAVAMAGGSRDLEKVVFSADPIADLGRSGIHLWQIYRDPKTYRSAIEAAVDSPDADVSFHAAAVMAMWKSTRAEARLLAALADREPGPAVLPHVRGAFAQEIDLPRWLLAVLLLRGGGTNRCLPVLENLAMEPNWPLNVRTILALTVEALASPEHSEICRRIVKRLIAVPPPDIQLPPTRSLRRALEGQPQLRLGNDTGAEVRQDHTWQLHLVTNRIYRKLGEPFDSQVAVYRNDPRAFVRRAFEKLGEWPSGRCSEEVEVN